MIVNLFQFHICNLNFFKYFVFQFRLLVRHCYIAKIFDHLKSDKCVCVGYSNKYNDMTFLALFQTFTIKTGFVSVNKHNNGVSLNSFGRGR